MLDSNVQALLGAVRRWLWRGLFVATVRRAMWGSAGLMLLVVTVQLFAHRVPVDVVLFALGALWTSMFVWAATRRPSDSVCALWADRHLGGASAFTTLLEVGAGAPARANGQAVRCLEDWVAAKVPESRRVLVERHEPARLSQPLFAMLVCAGLASLVLTLPDVAHLPAQPRATKLAPRADNRLEPVVEAPESAELVSEISSALRSRQSLTQTERRGGGRAPTADPGMADDKSVSATAAAGATPTGKRAAGVGSPGANDLDAAPGAGEAATAGTASGRDAGDSRDSHANAAASHVPAGTMPVQKLEPRGRLPSPARQADMDQLAAYDDDSPMQGEVAMRADSAVAAATPPEAAAATRLTHAEADYVQAWMKASAQGR